MIFRFSILNFFDFQQSLSSILNINWCINYNRPFIFSSRLTLIYRRSHFMSEKSFRIEGAILCRGSYFISRKQFKCRLTHYSRFFLKFRSSFKSYLENFLCKNFSSRIISLFNRNEWEKNKKNEAKRHLERNDVIIKTFNKAKNVSKRHFFNKTLKWILKETI